MSSLIEAAVQRFPLLEYVQGRGAVEEQAGQWAMTCPICGHERKLIVTIEKRAWKCWRCAKKAPPDVFGRQRIIAGAGGLIALIKMLENLDDDAARQFLITHTGALVQDLRVLPELEFRAPEGHVTFNTSPISGPMYWQPVDAHARAYLHGRGVSDQDIQAFAIGYCPAGRYAGRVIFPVFEDGLLVYFQARATWDSPDKSFRKALNPSRAEGAQVSTDVLMNLDQARKYPRVAITEGPMDCVHAGLDAVCTFGKQISSTQIAKLVRAGVRAVDLLWDGPSPKEPRGAWDEMANAVPALSPYFDVRLVYLPQGDPGVYPREALNYYRAQAVATYQRLNRL